MGEILRGLRGTCRAGFWESTKKILDAVAQAARLRDSIHVFRLLYGSGYLLVRAAAHIHNDFPKPRVGFDYKR